MLAEQQAATSGKVSAEAGQLQHRKTLTLTPMPSVASATDLWNLLLGTEDCSPWTTLAPGISLSTQETLCVCVCVFGKEKEEKEKEKEKERKTHQGMSKTCVWVFVFVCVCHMVILTVMAEQQTIFQKEKHRGNNNYSAERLRLQGWRSDGFFDQTWIAPTSPPTTWTEGPCGDVIRPGPLWRSSDSDNVGPRL